MSKSFWNKYRVSHPQAMFDRDMLFGILMISMNNIPHKTLLKYKDEGDGILAWDEFKEENEYNGSRELRLEQLEMLVTKPYSNKDIGGLATYIDKFQVILQEFADVRVLKSTSYS